MANIGKLNVQLGVDLTKFRSDMNNAFKTLNSNTAQMKRSLTGLQKGFDDVNKSVRFLTTGIAGIALVGFAKDALYAADAFNQLQGKIKNSIDASTQVDTVFKQLVDSSNRTGTAVDTVAQAFVRLRPAGLELGVTNDQLIQFNETFQKMGVLAGATSEEVSQTMIQLSQAIASNRLGGDELRSVLEQMPSVARTIADTMKIPMSQLKDVAKDGKITADVVFNAILGKTKEVDAQFSKLPASVERSANRVQNAFQVLVGEINKSTGATQIFSDWLNKLATFLQKNQKEIVATAKFLAQMGETAVQIGKVVYNSIGVVVNAVGVGITYTVNNALKTLDILVNGSIRSVNSLISLVNNIPGVKIGQLGNFNTPGLDFTGSLQKAFEKDFVSTTGKVGQGVSDLISGKSVFNGMGSSGGFGNSNATKSLFSGLGSGGGKGGRNGNSRGGGKSGKNNNSQGFGQVGIAGILGGAKGGDNVDEAQKELEKLKDLAKQWFEDTRTAQEKFNDLLAMGAKLRSQDLTDLDTYNRKIADSAEQLFGKENVLFAGGKSFTDEIHNSTSNFLKPTQDLLDDFKPTLKNIKTDLDDVTKSGQDFGVAIGNVTSQFGDRFFNTFMDSINTGKFAFKDFAASVLEDLSKLIFQLTVTIPLAQALKKALSPASGDSDTNKGGKNKGSKSLLGNITSVAIGALFSRLGFGGGGNFASGSEAAQGLAQGFTFAAGGADAKAGQPFVVGEKGPELFMPKTAGTIIPNHMLGGGSGDGVTLHQYFTINTIDNRDFQDRLAEHAKFIGNVSVQALQRNENRMGRRGPMDRT